MVRNHSKIVESLFIDKESFKSKVQYEDMGAPRPLLSNNPINKLKKGNFFELDFFIELKEILNTLKYI